MDMDSSVNANKNIIESAIREFTPCLVLTDNSTFDDVKNIIRVFMRKHPEIFWFSHQYLYDEKTGILKFKYNFTKEKANFFRDEIEKVVKEDFQIDHVKTLTELERVVYIYKWIANRTTYNEYSSFNQTIYSMLINRNSVCTGYAKTAQYLLGLVGIESQLVFGKFHSDKSEHGRHGWNVVKINGKWYHVDFCLADPTLSYLLNSEDAPIERDFLLWNYFGVTSDMILQNRSIECIETIPLCEDSLTDIPNVEVLKPQRQLICCKSDSGTSAKIYLDSFDKNKVIKVSRNEDLGLLQNEAEILSKLSDCKHVIKSYGLNDKGLELEQLTPWSELLNSHYYNPTESNLINILRQLIEGLIECSAKGISYSDIHYNNVFVTKDGTYKWGDFGIAFPRQTNNKLPPEMIGENGKPKGSFWFMAPETYIRSVFTESSAIYSVAMMAYFVMNDMRPPFWTDEEHQQEALTQRLKGFNLPNPVSASKHENLWIKLKKALIYSSYARSLTYSAFLEILQSESNTLSNQDDIVDCTYIAATHKGKWGDGGIHDTDSFACTAAIPGNTRRIDHDDFATTCIPNIIPIRNQGVGFCPSSYSESTPRSVESSSPNSLPKRETYGIAETKPIEKRSIWSNLFGKKEKTELVNASAYAPAEINPHKYFIVRVFIHKLEESSIIDQSVKDIDKTAIKKANKPLDIPIKEGDKITVKLSMTDGVSIDEPIQNVVWRGHHIECDFGCELINKNFHSVLGKSMIAINNVPCGDLKFTIEVVAKETPKVYARVEAKRYSKIFISYAHADYSQVRGIAEGCKMNGSDYFFDRHTLQAGDIFKEKILQYIDKADLFVLCWSKNAAESEWVQIERKHALELIKRGKTNLVIYPLSMSPEAPLPLDMSDKYNFGTL